MSTSRSDPRPGRTVVIGLGNPLMGDDGIGLAALARLRREWHVPPEVELVDGGTWGMNLLPIIEDAKRVLLIDAIEAGATPGTEVVVERQHLPRAFAARISPHQVDLCDVLAVAELRGTLPVEMTAVGLQPRCIELSSELSDLFSDRLDNLVRRVVRLLESWGHVCARREPVRNVEAYHVVWRGQ